MRIKRAVEIAMSNYSEVTGACVFSSSGKLAYTTGFVDQSDMPQIMTVWTYRSESMFLNSMPFLVALSNEDGIVAINPEGAMTFICGTGKGVWFVGLFAPMDADKHGLLKECVQVAKSLESSVSVEDI